MEIRAGQDRQKFTIKDIEAVCCVKASLLRQWQSRYGILESRQLRIYDEKDVKKFLAVSFLYHNGHKVSKVAMLSTEALNTLKVNTMLVSNNTESSFVLPLLECVIDINQRRFAELITDYCSQIGIENFVLKIAYPLLQKIKILFPPVRAISARQTLFSFLIQQKIVAATDALATSIKVNSVVLFSPDATDAELSLLFINYLFKKHGWQTFYFGTAIKWQQLQSIINSETITTIYVHCGNQLSRFEIDDYLEGICKAFPQKQIAASGTAVQQAQRTFVNLHLLQSDEAILAYAATKATSAAHTSAHLLL